MVSFDNLFPVSQMQGFLSFAKLFKLWFIPHVHKQSLHQCCPKVTLNSVTSLKKLLKFDSYLTLFLQSKVEKIKTNTLLKKKQNVTNAYETDIRYSDI